MRGLTLSIAMVAGLAGCAQVLGVQDVAVEHRIGGQVRGLWDGADGVALQLTADGVSDGGLVTVTGNGQFQFTELLDPGASYIVTVKANPVGHRCMVDGGGNGRVSDTDVTNVSIACMGPALSITMSGPWGWTFDPTQDTQTFEGSVATQDVVLTISGDEITGAHVNGAEAPLGQPMTALGLPLGKTVVPVVVNGSSTLSKTYHLTFDRDSSVLEQTVYGKSEITNFGDRFGSSVALSGDTLAVGANFSSKPPAGDLSAGHQPDIRPSTPGAVYVFVRNGTTWVQQAYLVASNMGEGCQFGKSVALFGDTLAVGAPEESSAATGINPTGGQADHSALDAGAVYIFARSGTTWTQQAYVKASNTNAGDQFGSSVALSGDTLAVGAPSEDSVATGVNIAGSQTDNSASNAGAVYVFVKVTTTWTQQAYVKASNTDAGDQFGSSVALSGDTLAVGAPFEGSVATGVNPVGQADNSTANAGAVYVFTRLGIMWTQQAYIKASNTDAGDQFGSSVALSGDTLAIGALNEASAATGVNPSSSPVSGEDNNDAGGAGAVYVFVRNAATWTQQVYVKASNTDAGDQFGSSVALAGDTLAVGALDESSAATGINATSGQADNSAGSAGAVYVFVRTGTTWIQQAYVKASNTGAGDQFGSSVALSEDTLAIVAIGEASAATGINPANGQSDNSVGGAGAVYVFR